MNINYYIEPYTQIGGCQSQFLNWKSCLKQKGLNIRTDSNFLNSDLLHLFPVNNPSYSLALVNKLNLPFIVSTNYWSKSNLINNFKKYLIKKNLKNFKLSSRLHEHISRGLLFKKANFLIANSIAEKEKLMNDFSLDEKKIIIIRNTVDDKFINFPKTKIKNKEKYILTIASVDRRKNLHLISEICAKIKFEFRIYGPIMDKDYLDFILKIGKGYSKYCGVLKNASSKMIKIIDNSSLYILPSTWETPGLSAMQAAVRGVPLIVTNIGGAKEYFGDYAKYTNGKSLDVNDVLYFLENKKRNIDFSSYKFADKFSSKNITECLMRLYSSILNNKK